MATPITASRPTTAAVPNAAPAPAAPDTQPAPPWTLSDYAVLGLGLGAAVMIPIRWGLSRSVTALQVRAVRAQAKGQYEDAMALYIQAINRQVVKMGGYDTSARVSEELVDATLNMTANGALAIKQAQKPHHRIYFAVQFIGSLATIANGDFRSQMVWKFAREIYTTYSDNVLTNELLSRVRALHADRKIQLSEDQLLVLATDGGNAALQLAKDKAATLNSKSTAIDYRDVAKLFESSADWFQGYESLEPQLTEAQAEEFNYKKLAAHQALRDATSPSDYARAVSFFKDVLEMSETPEEERAALEAAVRGMPVIEDVAKLAGGFVRELLKHSDATPEAAAGRLLLAMQQFLSGELFRAAHSFRQVVPGLTRHGKAFDAALFGMTMSVPNFPVGIRFPVADPVLTVLQGAYTYFMKANYTFDQVQYRLLPLVERALNLELVIAHQLGWDLPPNLRPARGKRTAKIDLQQHVPVRHRLSSLLAEFNSFQNEAILVEMAGLMSREIGEEQGYLLRCLRGEIQDTDIQARLVAVFPDYVQAGAREFLQGRWDTFKDRSHHLGGAGGVVEVPGK